MSIPCETGHFTPDLFADMQHTETGGEPDPAMEPEPIPAREPESNLGTESIRGPAVESIPPQEAEPEPIAKPESIAEPESMPEPATLETLRRRVAETVKLVTALRETNADLLKKVRDLEKRPAVHPDHAFFSVPRTPDALKNDLRSFIETLDEHIERAHNDA